MTKRKYQQTRRAEQQCLTRQRILDAACALHAEQGSTGGISIKAVASQAGVQRLTVYRHFKDDACLLLAAAQQQLTRHPPPDFNLWSANKAPLKRFREAQLAFFRYYHSNWKLLRVYFYEQAQSPELTTVVREFDAYREQIRDDLLDAWQLSGAENHTLRLTLDHCLRYTTWEALHKLELTDKQKLALVEKWVLSTTQKGDTCQIKP